MELVLVTHGFAPTRPTSTRSAQAPAIPLTVLEAPADQVFGAILNSAGRAA